MLRILIILVAGFQLALATGHPLIINCFAEEVKHPDVAGGFYPADPRELSRQIDYFIRLAESKPAEPGVLALISPHAGYSYSGSVAAYGYKAVKGASYDTVVVIAPAHRLSFRGIAVWPKGEFSTPLGSIAVDNDFSIKLMELDHSVKDIPEAFYKEHSLEVQLPFLQRVLKDFKIVPLVMGDFDLGDCRVLAHALKILSNGRRCLVVASTDLSHYHSYQEANAMDQLTLGFIRKLDADGLYQQAQSGRAEACGLGAVLTVLAYARENRLSQAEILKYANSADVTGDYSQVVGYAAVALYRREALNTLQKGADMLNKEQRQKLLAIARGSIENYLKTGKELKLTESDPVLCREAGAFVTLHKDGQLRGCIGNMAGKGPLYLTVRDMAVEAAVGDPRFPALVLSDLKDVEIEISALSPLERVDSADKIRLGEHGVVVRQGFNSGVFLPQVARETGWSKEEFLSVLCEQKAGLSADAWKDKRTELYVFTAEVFSE